jgi:hypothetical protein
MNMENKNQMWARIATIVVGIAVAAWGLFVIHSGKFTLKAAEPASPQEKISTQIAGIGYFFLGVFLIPTLGFILNAVGL